MTRALLAQINYIVDVAANMPANTHTTASGVFRLAWRGQQKSTTIVARLRTVNMYLPQPVASCLRSPPEGTQPPALSPVAFHPSAPSPVDFVHARLKFEYPLSLPGPFVEWYQSRRPRLMAACAHCRISAQLLEHAQIPELRAVVQVRVPLAGAPGGTALPSPATALLQAAGGLTWFCRCLESSTNQSLPSSRSPCGSRKTCCLRRAHPCLVTTTPMGASSITSRVRSICNTLSVQAALPLALLRSLTSMPWCACARPPATKSFRPACSGVSLPPPAPARRLRVPLMPDPGRRHGVRSAFSPPRHAAPSGALALPRGEGCALAVSALSLLLVPPVQAFPLVG